jgi:hypothetical protein
MIRIVEPLVDQDGTPLWLEHPEYGSRVDVVALPLTNVHNVQTYPYEIDPEHGALPLAIPADVSIVGFPFGTSVKGTAIWVRGTIASEPGIDYEGYSGEFRVFFFGVSGRVMARLLGE